MSQNMTYCCDDGVYKLTWDKNLAEMSCLHLYFISFSTPTETIIASKQEIILPIYKLKSVQQK